MRRYIPKNRFQYKIWWFVTSQPFEYAIFVLIMLNTVSLAMKFRGEPEIYTHALDILNLIFTAVFALEFVLKIMAFRFKVGYSLFATSCLMSQAITCSRVCNKNRYISFAVCIVGRESFIWGFIFIINQSDFSADYLEIFILLPGSRQVFTISLIQLLKHMWQEQDLQYS